MNSCVYCFFYLKFTKFIFVNFRDNVLFILILQASPPPGPLPTLYFNIFILKYENFMFHVFVFLMNVLQRLWHGHAWSQPIRD